MSQPIPASSPPLPIPSLPPERAAAGLLRLCACWFSAPPACVVGELHRVLADLWAKADSATAGEAAFLAEVLWPTLRSALSERGTEEAEKLLAFARTVPLPGTGEALSASLTARPALCAMQQTISTFSPPPNVPTRKNKRRPAAV